MMMMTMISVAWVSGLCDQILARATRSLNDAISLVRSQSNLPLS